MLGAFLGEDCTGDDAEEEYAGLGRELGAFSSEDSAEMMPAGADTGVLKGDKWSVGRF